MMKKVLSGLLLFALLFGSFYGCGETPAGSATGETIEAESAASNTALPADPVKSVAAPLEKVPDYTLSEGASTDQMRRMAIQAMRDMLSVHWTPAETFTYGKEGTGAGKTFRFVKGKTYAGLPYTDAGTHLFQFLEYYDFETGVLNLDFSKVNSLVGNVCGGAVIYGWSSVCPGITGEFQSGAMTRAQGIVPVGPYTYDESITSFHPAGHQTVDICRQNGEKVMFESYAAVKFGDGITSSGENSLGRHTLMCIENARVERDAAGNILPDKSFLVVQDQRMGGFEVKEGEETVSYMGRLSAEISFTELFHDSFLPITPREFAEGTPYKNAEVTFTPSEGANEIEKFLSGTLESNYVLAVVKCTLTAADGSVVDEKIDCQHIPDIISGEAFCYHLEKSGFAKPHSTDTLFSSKLEKGKTYTLTLTARPVTGKLFTALQFEFIA